MSRVSRSVSAGKLADLNVNGEFFLGGHETYNFTRLPHDLPLHTGFTGCIFDLVLRCRRKYLDVCKISVDAQGPRHRPGHGPHTAARPQRSAGEVTVTMR